VGVLTRRHGDVHSAEDAAQEAALAAAVQWPRDGVPDRPLGWLVQVATRRLVDQVRTERARRERESLVAVRERDDLGATPADEDVTADGDDTLVLLFLCCHPSLSTASAVALTLRAVGGLSTEEIARAFLVPPATMAQRISRAKQTLRAQQAPFRMPERSDWRARLDAVLHVLYLVFSEGSTASGGASLQRPDLAREAVRITRDLHRLLPEEPEVAGLLALMVLTDARSPARTSGDGALVPLAEQDRSRWDGARIAEGTALVTAALRQGRVGQYQVQAAIAAVHDEAPTAADTDWPQVLALYGVLERITDNPLVSLNRTVALAMVHGPAAGLAALDRLAQEPRLAGTHRVAAVRGHLLEAEAPQEAAAAYLEAAARTTNLPEREYLRMRAARLVRG
jgi:RNA polymerase sigma factor (sigma-70 family)